MIMSFTHKPPQGLGRHEEQVFRHVTKCAERRGWTHDHWIIRRERRYREIIAPDLLSSYAHLIYVAPRKTNSFRKNAGRAAQKACTLHGSEQKGTSTKYGHKDTEGKISVFNLTFFQQNI